MHRRRGWTLLALGVVLLTVSAGCARHASVVDLRKTSPDEASLGSPDVAGEYRLRVGDELEIRFISGPRYSYKTQVTPEGTISVPTGVEVVAAGRTLAEVRAEVASLMSELLRDPEPLMTLSKLGEHTVFVLGEVGGPGRVRSLSDMTVSMALAATGGLRSTGKPSSIMVVRTYGVPEPVAFKVDMSKVFSGEDLTQDIPLVSNDVVYVPRSVIGDVGEFVQLFFTNIAPAQVFYLRGYDMMTLEKKAWRW